MGLREAVRAGGDGTSSGRAGATSPSQGTGSGEIPSVRPSMCPKSELLLETYGTNHRIGNNSGP